MAHGELADAAAALQAAAEAHDDDTATNRLREHAGQLTELAARDRGPDHGRLARHLHVLNEVATDAPDEAATEIERARALLTAYRETVEGV